MLTVRARLLNQHHIVARDAESVLVCGNAQRRVGTKNVQLLLFSAAGCNGVQLVPSTGCPTK